MTRSHPTSRRTLLLAIALATTLLASLVGPAAAVVARPDTDPAHRGEQSVRQAVVHRPDRVRDVPDPEIAIRLQCVPRSTDRAAVAVACVWSTEGDVAVRSWQLWKLRVRPESDGRMLVAEVGAATTRHLDTEVSAPARYLYAVLALDGNGEIVGRSRLRSVTVPSPAPEVEVLRLECAAHRQDGDPAPGVTVGCDWSDAADGAAAGYVVWKRTDDGARTVLARVGPATTAIRDDAVVAGHRYGYVVTAVDAAGHLIARSRPATVAIPWPERPVEPAPVAEPSPVRPVEPPAPVAVQEQEQSPERLVEPTPEVAAARPVEPAVAERSVEQPVERAAVRGDRPAAG